VLTIIILIAAAFTYSPSTYNDVARSSIFALLSMANIDAWLSSGYFEADASIRPFLHYWSLGVEEQFYIIWPPLIIAFSLIRSWKFRLGLAIAFILASLALSHFFTASHPSAAFYLMPFRAFEFAIGGLAATSVIAGQQPIARSSAIHGLGYALLAGAVFTFSEQTPFPGVTALLPVLGATLCIMSHQSNLSRWITASGPAVWVGKISCSLYLVHWPVFVFLEAPIEARLFEAGLPHAESLVWVVLLALTTLLSIILYEAVEQSFRNRGWEPARLSSNTAVASALFMLLTAAIVVVPSLIQNERRAAAALAQSTILDDDSNALDLFASAQINRYQEIEEDALCEGRQNFCVLGDASETPHVAIIGDSHARHYGSLLAHVGRARGFSVQRVSLTGCSPPFRLQAITDGVDVLAGNCVPWYTRFPTSTIENPDIDTIVMAGRWGLFSEETQPRMHPTPQRWPVVDGLEPPTNQAEARITFERSFRQTMDEITAAGKSVLIMGQVPYFNIDGQTLERCSPDSPSGWSVSECGQFTREDVLVRQSFFEETARTIAAEYPNVHFVSAVDVLCPQEQQYCYSHFNGVGIYRDRNHLTPYGSVALGRLIWPAIEAAIGPDD